jgi:hypothetical protein
MADSRLGESGRVCMLPKDINLASGNGTAMAALCLIPIKIKRHRMNPRKRFLTVFVNIINFLT